MPVGFPVASEIPANPSTFQVGRLRQYSFGSWADDVPLPPQTYDLPLPVIMTSPQNQLQLNGAGLPWLRAGPGRMAAVRLLPSRLPSGRDRSNTRTVRAGPPDFTSTPWLNARAPSPTQTPVELGSPP